jgi:hypothetical protein
MVVACRSHIDTNVDAARLEARATENLQELVEELKNQVGR